MDLSIVRKGIVWAAVGGGIVVFFIGLNVLSNHVGRSLVDKRISKIQPSSVPMTPTPTPRPLTSKGVYKFSIMGGEGKQGLIKGGVITPVDPVFGGKQEMELTVTTGAQRIYVILLTDTKEKKVALTKDPSKPDVWRGSWTMDDTYSYIYTLTVQGTIGGDVVTVPIMFR